MDSEAPTSLDRFVAARPAGEDATLEAIVASRLFGAAQAPQAKVARFTLLERVGRGSTGDVYAAYDPILDRKVALKLLRTDLDSHPIDTDRREWLLREARAAARLSHPNVVAIHEVGEHEDSVYVAMEFVAGQTLRAWLRDRGQEVVGEVGLEREIVELFVQAGLGLAAAHAADLIHRDFKPDNVLVWTEGEQLRCKVVDFGLAGVVERNVELRVDALASREFSTVAGTPGYMSPEQLRGLPLDARSDQFSFCVALSEALSGEHPHLGALEQLDPLALSERICAGQAKGREALPAWLRSIVERGMATEPGERFPSMEALLDALRAGPRGRVRAAAVLGVVALLATLGGALELSKSAPEAAPSCSALAQLEGVWDEPTRARAREAFLGVGFEASELLWGRLEQGLDDYAREWLISRERSCIEGDSRLSSSLALLRERCLDRRRGELAGLSSLATRGDREAALAAVRAADRLTPLSACDDLDSLEQEAARTAAGDEPVIDALRVDIARVSAQARAGFERALSPEVEGLLERAEQLGAGVAKAEALILSALVADARGDYQDATLELERALLEAVAARHHRLHAEAATRLVWAHGVRLRDPEAAARWSAHAQAAIEANREDPVQLGRLLGHRGVIASQALEFGEAERLHRESIEQFEQAPTPAERELIFAHHNLGLALDAQAKHAEAETILSRSLADARNKLGEGHPDVAKMLGNVGQAYRSMGQGERALAMLEQSLALQRGLFGEEHITLYGVMSGLASTYSQLGRTDEARGVLERAIAIVELNDGPESVRLDALLHELALSCWLLGEPQAALEHATRLRAIQLVHYGSSHTVLALTLELIAVAQLDLGQVELAQHTIEQALVQLDADEGELKPIERGNVLLSAAIIGHESGRPRAEVVSLTHAARALLGERDPEALERLEAFEGMVAAAAEQG